MKILCLVLALGAINLSAADAPKDSAPPARVSKEVMRFLETRLTFEMVDVEPTEVLVFQLKAANVPLLIETTEKASDKYATFKLENATLAEALRTLCEKTGTEYRIVGSSIRLAMPNEWKDIDAGKTTFDTLKKKEE